MASSLPSWNYDVFLSFRGEDTRKTFVDHLYAALGERLIHTYKDDETLPRGDSISPSLLKAIEGSQIAVIIFSIHYADSSWCLDELAYVMKCRVERGQTVIPIFYNVDPSEVRKQEGKFGKALSKQTRKNITKTKSWRNALVDASNIAGWEPKHIANGHESISIKKIVDTISDKLFSLNSDVDDDLVGMRVRLRSLKSLLEVGSGGVHMVGIWGVGGSGKTTLASSAYMEICRQFEGHCIIDNIREESIKQGLKYLQEKVLSVMLKMKVVVQSVEEGKYKIRSRLSRSKVLIVLDDVDDLSQIEALAGSHKWFGDGSRIIITTRDEHLLIKHNVYKIYASSLLSHDEAIRLFNRHAYKENKPIEDYDMLSRHVVSYAGGLPLALKVLGSFLCDKDKNEWMSAIAKLKDIPNLKIVDKLKISYDGLEPYEKELFLDIACLFRRERVNEATEILDACGFHPGIGIKVLRQKALITISNGKFDMHDLVQEMGHYIIRGQHPYNPEKHSRVWYDEEIENMCSTNATTENDTIQAIRYDGRSSSGFLKLVSVIKKLRLLYVPNHYRSHHFGDQDLEGPKFLSNELRYIYFTCYPGSPLPGNFQPTKLVVLKLCYTLQKELWKGYKRLPHLKELYVSDAKNLLSTPDFDGLPSLEKLSLCRCNSLEKIDPSLRYHKSLNYVYVSACEKLRTFPTIVRMKKLEILTIRECAFLEFPEIQASIDSLVDLSLSKVGIEALRGHFVEYFPRFLRRLDLRNCGLKDGDIPSDVGELFYLKELYLCENKFSRLQFSLLQLTQLKVLNLNSCYNLLELPELPSGIAVLKANKCYSLKVVGDFYTNRKWLCEVSLFNCENVTGAESLLQSMLHAKAIENHYMRLHVDGLEIPKMFIPPLLRGQRCRLQLPQNWCNDFCGFLICAVLTMGKMSDICALRISLKHEQDAITGMDPQPGFWKECDNDKYTWVRYVSFGSLRHTTWWESKYNVISFSMGGKLERNISEICSGFGVRLVSRNNRSYPTKTTDSSDVFDEKNECMLKFYIEHDSKSALEISA